MNSVASPLSPETAERHRVRSLLVNDEGNAALHFIDREFPDRNWSYRNPGRDLQLIGDYRVLRSHPQGFVELDLERRGTVVREVFLPELPGSVESARRLTNQHTIIAGNGGGGSFLWELDREHALIQDRRLFFPAVEKVRLVRRTEQGTYLFCSERAGTNTIHEADFQSGLKTLFEVPSGVPADSMVKAVRIAGDVITVSSGYAASLLVIDTRRQQILATVGGKSQPEPADLARPLSPFFFSGYQMLENGDYLLSNWQGHSAAKNDQGYQLLRYDAQGKLIWAFDQSAHPHLSSLNNVILLDGLDLRKLHDEPRGVLVPSE
jgi:hypothetical protein